MQESNNESKQETEQDAETKQETDQADLILKIQKQLVEPAYYWNIQNGIVWNRRWKTLSKYLRSTHHLFNGIAAMLAFANTSFQLTSLSFLAGCFCVASALMAGSASYASRESVNQLKNVNIILNNLNIKNLPIAEADIESVKS